MLSFLSVSNTTPLIYDTLVVIALCERGRCAAHEIMNKRNHDGAFCKDLCILRAVYYVHMLHYAHYSTHLVFLFIICFWAFDLRGLVGVWLEARTNT